MTPLPPYLAFRSHRDRYVQRTVTYGNGQRLDIWCDAGEPRRCPIMIFVPGGGWVSGSRATGQGHALMSRMVQRGWVCLSIDYRTAPVHRWPAPFEDVCASIRWAHGHADEFGGDRDFIAIAGCSAGGHMATLAGLRPGFVDAAVSIYGSYDWVNRSTWQRKVFMNYLEHVVVGRRYVDNAHVFRDASPMHMMAPMAAPMMVVHGANDLLIPVAEARTFSCRLIKVSESPVIHLEIPGAVHGFDLVQPGHTAKATRAISGFLERELSALRSQERITS